MRVVHINETCGTGSIGRLAKELSQELVKRGYDSIIAYSTLSIGFNKTYKIGGTIGKKVHSLLSRITGKQGYYSKHSTKKFISYLKEVKPDIVHIHNLHSNYINLKILFTYLGKNDIATVITLHDCWMFTGKCTYYVPANCKKWQQECGSCPLLYIDNINKTYLFDRTRKMFNDKKKLVYDLKKLTVVGVSKWVSNEAKKSFLSTKNIVPIYNWIDMNNFKPSNTDKLRYDLGIENKFIILGVSVSWSKHKGLNDFLHLAAMLDENYSIILVGKFISSMELPKNIIHIEHTNDIKELANYYSMADVFINPSQYETFGMTTAEALSCGTPVIVYNNTASPELVGENCGCVVEEHLGIDGIIHAVNIIKNKSKANYADSCLSYAKIHFSKEVNSEKYIQLYKSLLM